MTKDWVGNKNSVFKTLGASNHTERGREKHDYYATEPIAVDGLVDYYEIPLDPIWECACGEGHLTNRLRSFGYRVVSSDIIDRMGSAQRIMNFLKCTEMPVYAGYDGIPEPCKHIITNPPYKYAMEFVLHAIKLLPEGGLGAFLLKTTFLEGQKRFEELFRVYPLKVVLQFVRRIKCAKNGDFGDIGSSAMAYAWYVWEKGCRTEPIIRWINRFHCEY